MRVSVLDMVGTAIPPEVISPSTATSPPNSATVEPESAICFLTKSCLSGVILSDSRIFLPLADTLPLVAVAFLFNTKVFAPVSIERI